MLPGLMPKVMGPVGIHTLQESSVERMKIFTPALLTLKRWLGSPKEMPEMENRIRMETLLSSWRNNVGGVYPV